MTSLSSDWYWEQDTELRFTQVDVQTGTPGEQELARNILGKRRWETGIDVEGGWAAHRALLKARAPFREVLMWRDFDDGSRRYVSVSGEPVFDARGRFTGYRGVGRDVTEQKRGEQLLRLQHTVTRRLAEAPSGAEGCEAALHAICESENWDCGELWRLDEAAGALRRFVHWSLPGAAAGQKYAEASGRFAFLPGQGLVGSVWQSAEPLWIPDALNDSRAARKSLAEHTGLPAALLCPVASGGRVVGVMGFVCTKIRPPDEALLQALMAIGTQLALFLRRAEAEAGLRESEARFRSTFELAGVGIAHIGLDRRFLRVNARFCEILGYSAAELIGRTGRDISHPEDKDVINEQRGRLYAGDIDSVRGEKRYVHKDGSVVWVAFTLALERDAAGKPLYEIAVYDDISGRKAAEEALRASEARFRQVVDSANEGILVYDRALNIVSGNAAAERIIGVPLGELIGKPGFTSLFPCVHEDGSPLEPQDRPTRVTTRRGAPLTGTVIGLLRPDRGITWLSVNTAFLRRPGETEHYGIVATISDITARRRIELELRDSEGRFRSLTELSSDWFWEQDAEYRFTRLEGRNVAGGDKALRHRLIGTRRWDSGLHVEGGWEAHRALLDARKPFHDVLMWRTMSDGSLRYVMVDGEPVFAADGSFAGYRGVGRDVTEEKRAEQRLRLEHHVANALSEAEDARAGLGTVMRLVGEAEGWACGRYFGVDEAADELVYRHGWSVEDAGLVKLLERSQGLRFKRGEGLAGLAWQTGEPTWSADASQDCAFVFGVMVEGKTLGVLSFTSQAVRKPDERLLQATRIIGGQVGQFLRRMQAEESLRESEARFRSLTQMSSDFFWETDVQHRLVQMVHGASYRPTGFDAVGKATWELPSVTPDAAGWAAHRAMLDQRLPFRDFEFARATPAGPRVLAISGDPRFSPEGQFLGYRGVGRDITEMAQARERIASLAYSDALTGLDNRTSLIPALEKAVERTRRRGSKLAGLFLDLDGFKQINDAYGHDAGDRLLVEAARRLRASLRSSDPVARLGGDEFFVVLEDMNDAAPVVRVAQKLLSAILQPYDLGGKGARISMSIGISLFPEDAGDAATLMKHADMAMYHAKQAGKNGYRFFSSGPAANDGMPAVDQQTGAS